MHEPGTILIGMSHNESNQIKISARNVRRTGRNSRELLTTIMNSFEGEVGGHEFAAGCTFPQEKEEEFTGRMV